MPAHLHPGPACSGNFNYPCNPAHGCGCKTCLSGGALLLCQQMPSGQCYCFHSGYYLADDVLSDAEAQRIQASLKGAPAVGARASASAPRPAPAPPSAPPPAANDPLGNVIQVFASRQGNGVFPKIPRQQLAKDLLMRARDPLVINQGPTYMCGPAAFMYSLARDNPVRFVLIVADLYEHGYARAGDLLGDDASQRSTSIVANHFVILTSPILENDTGLTFTVYTWRSEKREAPMKMAGKPAGRVPIPVFLSKYYGFIAGKP